MSQIVWLTGLSGSGKTTIVTAMKSAWTRSERLSVLDGDVLRQGLCSGLGYSALDRRESLRRAAEAAVLVADTGAFVIAAFITPTETDRNLIREICARRHVLKWIYVSTPLVVCEGRDPKGHYQRARLGTLKDFTGISAPFEQPRSVDLALDTSIISLSECVANAISLFPNQIIQ